jgi:hypothetical protein
LLKWVLVRNRNLGFKSIKICYWCEKLLDYLLMMMGELMWTGI